jgi:hypothetical protein
MKAFLVIVVVIVAAMALLGWLTFSGSTDRASISIETKEIKEDVGRAVESGKEYSEKARRETRAPQKEPSDGGQEPSRPESRD